MAGLHFLRKREVCERYGIKCARLDRMVRMDMFPRPFLIGVKAKAFSLDECEAWLAERSAARADYIDPANRTSQTVKIVKSNSQSVD